jgi:hypothetical protein
LTKQHADVEGSFRQWNDMWLYELFNHFDICNECRQITAPLRLMQGVNDEYATMLHLSEMASAPTRPAVPAGSLRDS